MEIKTDGGPAFPQGLQGMTLRDYFAGQYLAGRMARPLVVTDATKEYINDDLIAQYAYELADAMLKERIK